MTKIRQVLTAVTLAVLIGGPAYALPSLSAHLPTLSSSTAPGSPAPLSKSLPLGLFGVAGAITVKDTATVAQKFVTRASAAAPDYATGVQGAGPKWLSNAAAAEPNYVQGVQAAASRGAYGKGLQKHGAQKYQDNATKLGSQRYGPGVANAQAAYARGVDPYLNVLKGLDLPKRGPKGSPQNSQRSAAVAVALNKAKVGG